MAKYRKKPVEIAAVQWTGVNYPRHPVGNATEVIGWVLDNGGTARWHEADWLSGQSSQFIAIDTLEGVMRASVGDFIIRGVQGEFYPCKLDIFEATYESVSS